MKRLASLFIALTIVLGVSASVPLATAAKSTAVIPMTEINEREIIVEFDSSRAGKSVSALLNSKGLSHARSLPLSYKQYEIIQVPEDMDYFQALAALEADPAVVSASPNVIKRVSETVLNDPLLFNGADDSAEAMTNPYVKNNQWALIHKGCLDAWDTTRGNPNVVVAVLDTGINFDHEDLQNRLWVNDGEIPNNDIDDDGNGFIDDVNGYDFDGWKFSTQSGGDPDPTDPTASDSSHGTSTSSIVLAQGNNGIGMAGVAGGDELSNGARLMVCRVGTNLDITVDAEIGALDYAVNNGAKVISMSFGGFSGGLPEQEAIDRAWNGGAYVIAASGNIGQGNYSGDTPLVDLPAGFDNCVAVGATTIFGSQTVAGSTSIIDETVASYTKTGPEMEISAPGTHIMAAANDTDLYTNSVPMQFTGTSAATPVVAGLAALLWSADYELNGGFTLNNQQMRDLINNTAVDLGDVGRDAEYGYGSIEMAMAMLQINPDGGKLGDTDGDGDVDADDILPIINAFGARQGEADYSSAIDTNNDGFIDELDLFEVGRQFGK